MLEALLLGGSCLGYQDVIGDEDMVAGQSAQQKTNFAPRLHNSSCWHHLVELSRDIHVTCILPSIDGVNPLSTFLLACLGDNAVARPQAAAPLHKLPVHLPSVPAQGVVRLGRG